MGQVVAQTLVAVGVIVAVGSAEVLDGLVGMGSVSVGVGELTGLPRRRGERV